MRIDKEKLDYKFAHITSSGAKTMCKARMTFGAIFPPAQLRFGLVHCEDDEGNAAVAFIEDTSSMDMVSDTVREFAKALANHGEMTPDFIVVIVPAKVASVGGDGTMDGAELLECVNDDTYISQMATVDGSYSTSTAYDIVPDMTGQYYAATDIEVSHDRPVAMHSYIAEFMLVYKATKARRN